MNYFIMANTSRKSNYQNLQVNTVILTVLKMNILVVEWQDMQIKCSTHSRSTSNQTLFTHLSIPIPATLRGEQVANSFQSSPVLAAEGNELPPQFHPPF